MYVRCEGSELSIFWTASEWPTERGICDEPRVQTRFWCHNPVVLCCTIVWRAIGEQRGYAAKISVRSRCLSQIHALSATLGGFRTYPFLYTCVGPWYLEMCGSYDASLLNTFLTSRMVVERKVELTQGN
jgi:hypothetical protein